MRDLFEKNVVVSNRPTKSDVGGLAFLFSLSCLVNILFLTGPLFMMQVYDRFLPSGNLATLFGLFGIALIMYFAFGVFDVFRLQIAAIRGEAIAQRYSKQAFEKSVRSVSLGKNGPETNAPEDVEVVRNFLTSPSLMALFDLPSIPIFFIAVSLLHPTLGLTVLVAGCILAALAVLNERLSRKAMEPGRKNSLTATEILSDARADAVSLNANQMTDTAAMFWQREDEKARTHVHKGTKILSSFGSITKTLRMIIQSMVLAIGGWLVLEGNLSAGAMIAASVVFARAIAPIEQTLGNYRQLLSARSAWNRIKKWCEEDSIDGESFQLPEPAKSVVANGVSIASPATGQTLVEGVSFSLQSRDVLGVVGASGAGKSTLANALVGVWPIQNGRLLFDDAEIGQWSDKQKSKFIGYLGQSVRLIDATLAENISRFDDNASPEKVIEASKIAGVHQLILSMPDGYETRVGRGGVRLSGGQCQRIGLARALYSNPFVLVLDEPTAHLDPVGKEALIQLLRRRRAENKITIITTHDETILKHVTKLAVLEKGQMVISGPRDAVQSQLKSQNANSQTPIKSDASFAMESV